jgi:hypothetical protein
MGLIDTIFAWRAKPLGVEEAAANLEKLRQKRGEATAAIAEATERRQALMQREDSDDEIEAIDREIARHELRMERLDLAEPVALATLTEARNKARAAEWRRLAKLRFAADRKYAAALRASLDALAELVEISDRIHKGGFALEAAGFAIPPRVLNPDALALFEREAFRAESVMLEKPKPTPPPAAASPPPAKPVAAVAESAASPKPAEPMRPAVVEIPMPQHRLLKREPQSDTDGKSVVIVFAGLAANSPIKANEIVRLPHAECVALVKGRKGEFVDPDSLASPPREVASAFVPVSNNAEAAE